MLVYPLIKDIFPQVKKELQAWNKKAERIGNNELRGQAVNSIQAKSFHCMGGAVFALYPTALPEKTIRFIIAYQTISDYLDNLVDSMEFRDEKAFAHLHLALEDALDPAAELKNYYLYYPYQEERYLPELVKACQENMAALPQLEMVKGKMLYLAQLYGCLQTYKHLEAGERETKLLAWITPYLSRYKVGAWELAAAAGSTLGVFMLFAAAGSPALSAGEIDNIADAYFPWVGCLHILLDYLIDLEEDRQTGQFNFIEYYGRTDRACRRLHRILAETEEAVKSLSYPGFHRTVIQGLLAMYLSDAKTALPAGGASTEISIPAVKRFLLQRAGLKVRTLYGICRELRRLKAL